MNIRKAIIVVSVVFLIGIISLIVYFLIPKSYITFSTAPNDVTISIDGGGKKSISNGNTVTVSPGTHTVTVSRTQFDSYKKEITLKKGQTSEFLVALNPQTDAARALLRNDASQAVMQRFYGKTFSQQTKAITDNYPLVAALPIQARLYTIYACKSEKYPTDASKIAICVDLYTAGLEPYVLKDITSRGYNPSDYEILWQIKYSTGD